MLCNQIIFVLRLTLSGLAILDATDTSVVHAYYSHENMDEFEESTSGKWEKRFAASYRFRPNI